MLSDREAISLQIQATLDDATEPWFAYSYKIKRFLGA